MAASIRLIATWLPGQGPETDTPVQVEWCDPRIRSSAGESQRTRATLDDFARIKPDTQSDPIVHEDGRVSYRYEVEPEYTYELDETTIYCTATVGSKSAECAWDVTADGLERDTSFEECEENPFDSDGWPNPPADLVEEGREAALKISSMRKLRAEVDKPPTKVDPYIREQINQYIIEHWRNFWDYYVWDHIFGPVLTVVAWALLGLLALSFIAFVVIIMAKVYRFFTGG